MSIENLKTAIPEFAKDLKLNLGSISRTTALDEEQLWGTLLACAAATRNTQVLAEIGAEAADTLSAEAYQAALGAASIMGMNNVFYRGRHFLDGKYDDLRPGLRMNIIGNPGVSKVNFELWCFAVSAING
ncbi:MAG TPA: alkyl hydroperoxide reductase, partial [Mycobacterium sp.]|nr:alkyl hydroperoxide reductase [Mycobacterium sp.]